MQPATEASDVYSLAATLYALLTGGPPGSVAANPVGFEQIAVAETPIAPVPGVDPNLMDALITALSNDPAARPTAAAFGEQLAKVPALRTSPRDVRVGDEGATWGAVPACLPGPAVGDPEEPQYSGRRR